jgi:hypothetical protein
MQHINMQVCRSLRGDVQDRIQAARRGPQQSALWKNNNEWLASAEHPPTHYAVFQHLHH